ncbi:MAG TPA: PQQ-binding-like beta-propeller repeat protein [Gaiellaceae bacterium]|nr:PQQ-binding-like beta-propeller repeat protein [Gaiellaceae bacterium]
MATNPTKIPAGLLGKAALVAALIAGAVALAGCGGSSNKASSTGSSAPASHAASVGNAPPEWAANTNAWPAHNYDLSNTRATTNTEINSANVSKLKVKWTFALKGASVFGVFSSTPIVLNGIVYLQDLNSNVYALDRSTGKLKWRHMFNSPDEGPNGVAFGYGRLYGATASAAFALDAQSGKLVWSRKLIRNGNEGIDMTPQIYDNTVLVSTVPGNPSKFYAGNGDGIVWALDAQSGQTKWKFNTIQDGAKLFGNPKVNSGGGLWYPPAVDNQGRVFLSVANPAPLYGTPKFPDGSSRPGPNLYTDSIVALNGKTGKLIWFQQAIAHDTRDYDLMIPAITTTVPLNGVQTEIVLVAGKMGKAFAYRADNGKHLWTRPVGRHLNDTGPLPKKPEDIFPGDLGGVETPMALADNRLFVPWADLHAVATRTGQVGLFNFKQGRGGLAAIDAASGKIAWQHKLPSMDFGAATVANDVVFTSDYAGTIYAYDTQSGKLLWTKKAPAGINSFPAIEGDTLLIAASTTGFDKKPQFELIAYSLNAPAGGPKTQAPPASKPKSPASGPAAPANAKGSAVHVKGGEFFFRLSTKSAASPGPVTFVFQNIGHVAHDFSIAGKTTPLIQPGQTATLTVTLKKGSFPYLCTVPGHAEAGMKGVFTVR